jgi:putative membrane protein
MSWGTEQGDKAFRDAIAAIEDNSAVECVVAVRAYARRWMAAHVVVGLVAAYAVLIYTVMFALPKWAVLAFPLGAGIVSTLIVEYVPALYRFLVPAWLREQHVVEAARNLFYEKKVHSTRDRTGLLVFIAVRARTVEVIGDVGIVDKLGQTRLDHMAQALREALPSGPAAVGRTLANLAPEFAEYFPRRADDKNELPDDVVAVPPA